jgi:Tfp pilus assembly protein FimV
MRIAECGRNLLIFHSAILPSAIRHVQEERLAGSGEQERTMSNIHRTLILVGVVLLTHLSFVGRLHAFAVGDIKVQSHLGEPFVAEVPLAMQPSDRDKAIVAAIGNAKDYENEGITRDPLVNQLQPLLIVESPERIRIVSDAPIQTPAFDLVLLVRAGHVTIVRHYPIALAHPPVPMPMASVPAASAAVHPPIVSAVAPRRAVRQDATPASVKPVWIQRLPEFYGPIRPGETLYRVMEELRIPRPVIWQVAVVTWRTNEQQFANGNLHGLKSGRYLHFSSDLAQAIATLNVGEAQRIVAEQWEIWQTSQHIGLAKNDDVPLPEMMVEDDTLPIQEETPASASTHLFPTPQPAAPVNVTELQSVLKGFEERLAQRLSVSSLTPVEPADATTIPFVNTTELQDSLRGLEARLLQELQRVILPHLQVDGAQALLQSKQFTPALQEVKSLVAPLWSTNTLLYVLVAQNVLLFMLTVGFAWGWYRGRKQQALALLSHPQTRHTKFIPVAHDPAVQ